MDTSKKSILKEPVIITIIMNKGGVGKTTTSANLAAALIEPRPNGTKFNIGLIDLDPQTNLSSVFGLSDLEDEHGDGLATIAEYLDPDNDEINSLEFFYPVSRTYFDGRLHLLPGHIDLESLKDDIEFEMKRTSPLTDKQQSDYVGRYNVEGFENKKTIFFKQYRERLKKELAGKFDYIIIDTPPSRGFLTQFALSISDYVLPVMIPGTKELDGLITMEQLIADCWASYNQKLSVAGILINNLFEREVLSKDIRAIVLERYSGKELMLRTEIPRSVRIAESISNDQTIFESEHRDSEQYKEVYRKLLVELYSRELTTSTTRTVSPKFFYDLHYTEDAQVLEEGNFNGMVANE